MTSFDGSTDALGRTSTGPSARSVPIPRRPDAGGADAPAVMPTVAAPRQPLRLDVGGVVDQVGRRPRTAAATSTSRSEFEELAEPTTSTRSDSAAIARTACCRLVVA